MKHKLSRILALTLVLVMAVCTQAVAEGKTLRLTQNVEMDTMDSGNTGDGYTTSIMSLLVDSLFRLDENSQRWPRATKYPRMVLPIPSTCATPNGATAIP